LGPKKSEDYYEDLRFHFDGVKIDKIHPKTFIYVTTPGRSTNGDKKGMGLLSTSIMEYYVGNGWEKIIMLGLDNSGKTTILQKLRTSQDVNITLPTVGFQAEKIEHEDVKFSIFDIGGQDFVRSGWREFFNGTKGLIYVVDSCDPYRTNESSNELNVLLTENELADANVLILANKQDLQNPLSTDELIILLGLDKVVGRILKVQATSALTGDGIKEGMDWLSNQIQGQK